MKLALGAVLAEARSIAGVLREAHDGEAGGRIAVSGMLSEQLAKELGAGAEPGAVIAGGAETLHGARAIVHVMAGEPSAVDEDLVRRADELGAPVVLVQLWPQDEWTPPFVLTPFVVECRAGEGFPVGEIASRIVEAAGHSPSLARRVPVLHETVMSAVLRSAAVRAALIGLMSGSRATRPLLTLEQLRLVAQLHGLGERRPDQDGLRALAAPAAVIVVAGFVLRAAAQSAGRFLPTPLVNAGVAAAGTWALGVAFARVRDRLP